MPTGFGYCSPDRSVPILISIQVDLDTSRALQYQSESEVPLLAATRHGTYVTCEKQNFWPACANAHAQAGPSLCCSHRYSKIHQVYFICYQNVAKILLPNRLILFKPIHFLIYLFFSRYLSSLPVYNITFLREIRHNH